MDHFIIGTAGHVDHGKTALIKALTGTDTDSMPEEKKRGISIDLGFTYFMLPNGNKAGVIDVPGHEKFLSNMMAGVCGMDLVLLVIAADEGIMPQTMEHIEILNHLNVKQGIIVLTKSDLVEEGWTDLLEEDIKEELKDSICSNWPTIAVSAKTKEGISGLVDMIDNISLSLKRARNVNGKYRLPIDRVLSPKGVGTVVAGTLLEGSIHLEDEVMLYPEEKLLKIKSMQVHGQDTSVAYSGQRVAISIAGVEKKNIKRGKVLAYPYSICPSERIDVRLNIGANVDRVIKHQSRVHVHIGTYESIARIILLDKMELSAGESGFAQLVFQEKLSVKKGDNFVIRYYSPLETIGGGTVISPNGQKHKRFDEAQIKLLVDKENNKLKSIISSIISESINTPADIKDIISKSGMEKEEVYLVLGNLCQDQDIIELIGKKRNYYWAWNYENEFRRSLKESLISYHNDNPYSLGFSILMAKNVFLKNWNNEAVDAYIQYLKEQDILKTITFRKETYYRFYDIDVVQRDKENELKAQILQLAEDANYNLAELSKVNHSSLSDAQYKQYLDYLEYSGILVHIKDDMYTSKSIADNIIDLVNDYFTKEEVISFSTLRDLLGTTRKTAKPLMAWLDDCKITAWSGKETERRKR